jgi:hypothetical protein
MDWMFDMLDPGTEDALEEVSKGMMKKSQSLLNYIIILKLKALRQIRV